MRLMTSILAFLILPNAVGLRAADLRTIVCEGEYQHHLQGVCADDEGSIFWCFTTKLVKTDFEEKIIKVVDVANHHGDLCHVEGKIFVAVNLGDFNNPRGKADSWVYIYDADDLALLEKRRTPEVFHGAGGIASHDGRFMVIGGLPQDVETNYIYEYTHEFKFVKRHVLASGHTNLGIQTAAFGDGSWWFGCYGTPAVTPAKPPILLRVDALPSKVERFEFDASIGILPIGDGKFLVARGKVVVGGGGPNKEKQNTGWLAPAVVDEERGLRLVESVNSSE